MNHALPPPRPPLAYREVYIFLACILLVSIGGQCRGALAQAGHGQRKIASLREDDTRPVVRTTPMTAAEWAATWDTCVNDLGGQAVILASRNPGISAGVGCFFPD